MLPGHAPTRGFRCGPQATDWGTHPLGHFGSGSQAAGPFIRARAHPEFQLWAPSPLIWVRASGLKVSTWAVFPCSQFRGRGGRGSRGRGCCGEFSNYPVCASIFFSFLKNFSYSSPPGPNKHLAAHTAQPGSLPRILQQTLRPGGVFSCPRPCAGPGDLIVLKHSSYRQIFQCPLCLFSDLHICWNTVGCSLCSSDQLGISLALRGSGLHSHLCCHHLGIKFF